jgi:peptidyl-prolyl cis-trans isomerase D
MSKDDAPRRKKSSLSNVVVWIILILLVGGLAGVGIGGFAGSTTSVGSVGSTEITVPQYQRALQQELAFQSRLAGEPISAARARELGLDQRILRTLAANAALSEETKVMGLSVGDAEVLRELQLVDAFKGPDGQFDREAYEFALDRNNLRTGDFEDEIRLTASRGLLQQAITGGLASSETYGETLYKFLAESRSFRWAPISKDLLVSANSSPSEVALEAFHTENSEQFLTPQIRRITFAWLTPDMMLSSIEVPEDQLQALYEERTEQYNQPARRLIERLGFADTVAAQDAKDRITSGDTTFEALVEERGLTLADVDQGEVSRADLDGAIADAVFALTEPGLTDPVETSLGPAIYRINAILEPTSVPFEDAREELLQETALDEARRAIADQIVDIDDLLVGGASLEDLAKETELQLGQIDLTDDSTDGIAGYDNFRTEANRVTADDFPEIKELSDGGIFALRLEEIVEPQLPPLADIKGQVSEAWDTAETNRRLAELGDSLLSQLKSGTAMEALGLTPTSQADAGRPDQIDGAPTTMVAEVFKLEEGGIALVQDGDLTALVELTSILVADVAGSEGQAFIGQLNQQAAQSMAADVFEAFGQSVQARHGLTINSGALNALHSNY